MCLPQGSHFCDKQWNFSCEEAGLFGGGGRFWAIGLFGVQFWPSGTVLGYIKMLPQSHLIMNIPEYHPLDSGDFDRITPGAHVEFDNFASKNVKIPGRNKLLSAEAICTALQSYVIYLFTCC